VARVGHSFLRVHGFLPVSLANGPGARAVVWVQGCSLGCPGCFNPKTHPPTGGELVPVDDLFGRFAVLGDRIEGVTVSGGEPLEQCGPLARFLRMVKARTSLSVIVFTGLTWAEVKTLEDAADLLSHIDVLIAGRYEAARRLARDLRGSANQTVHFLSDRYRPTDLGAVPPAEVVIDKGGRVAMSGVEPPRWPGGDGEGTGSIRG